VGGSGSPARIKLPSAEWLANTYGDKLPPLKTFTQPCPADGVKRRQMPAKEEKLPKSKVQAPSCVRGEGQVGLLSEKHAPQTFLHVRNTMTT